jgi:hypothetical protein
MGMVPDSSYQHPFQCHCLVAELFSPGLHRAGFVLQNNTPNQPGRELSARPPSYVWCVVVMFSKSCTIIKIDA